MASGMIQLSTSGQFKRTTAFLNKLKQDHISNVLNKYGQRGVDALAKATPIATGETATSWYYKVEITGGTYTISWHNSHVENGVPIAIILQYGHGTRNGGYVQGRDYINPAMKPIFEQIKDDVWREVTSA